MANYKIVLRDKHGGFSKFGKAVTYEIWYGRKKIVKRTLFHRTKKKADQKKEFVKRLVAQIERARLRIVLAKERARAKEKAKRDRERKRKEREAKHRKLEQEKIRKQKEREHQKILRARQKAREKALREKRRKLEQQKKEEKKIFQEAKEEQRDESQREVAAKVSLHLGMEDLDVRKSQFDLLKDEEFDFYNVVEHPPQVFDNAVVEEITEYPYKPTNDIYVKSLIIKKFKFNKTSDEYSILDFTLKKPFRLVLTKSNFNQVGRFVFNLFIPHIYEQYNQSKTLDNLFLLRIKYDAVIDSEHTRKQGISQKRFFVKEFSEITQTLKASLFKFFGTKDEEGKLVTKNYLEIYKEIVITGFTFESSKS